MGAFYLYRYHLKEKYEISSSFTGVKRRGIARARGAAIKDNGGTTFFKKTFFASGKSKRGKDMATIGIAEERGTKRICLPLSAPAFASPRHQTYPLSCQLQPPRSTCFTHHFDVSPCHCDGTDRPESMDVLFNSFIEGNEFSRLCRTNDEWMAIVELNN